MWLIVFLFVFCYILWIDHKRYRHYREQLKNIPCISRIPIVGSLLVMATIKPDNMHLKFQEHVLRFGKSFYATVFGHLVVVTADVRHVETLLSSQKHIRKHLLYKLLVTWMGDGLLLSDGEKWQNMRKIITPTFHFRILEQFMEVFNRQSMILVEKLQPFADGENVIDIYPFVSLATLDIIAETAMGVRVNAQIDTKSEFVQAINDLTDILATRFVRPLITYPLLFHWLKPSLYKQQEESVRIVHTFTNNIIAKRRKVLKDQQNPLDDDEDDSIGLKKRSALLDVLLQSNLNGKPLPESQIRDEVNTFMFEGHDTTTSAISFCLFLISRHARVQQKLFEEIHSHFGNDLDQQIRVSDLQELEYLNYCIKESLRLYPSVPVIGRLLKEDCKLCDLTLPKGANVIILIWQILRDPEIFPEPSLFKPERHMDGYSRDTAFNYIPFSAGPRNCIGQRFALYEMKTVIIKVLRHYELRPLGEDVQPSIKLILRSKVGVNFGIRPRIYQ